MLKVVKKSQEIAEQHDTLSLICIILYFINLLTILVIRAIQVSEHVLKSVKISQEITVRTKRYIIINVHHFLSFQF